ncbi:MAG TPA: MGMT family protein [Candidatus Eisenbacteria bacterium]
MRRAGPRVPTSYARIWRTVRRIPRGRVASYGQVAAVAGLRGQARLVGSALHAAPGDAVPWHRVVDARGALSLGRIDAAGAVTQRLRLEREGVRFDARGRADLVRHRWRPRAAGGRRPRRA